MNEAIAIIRWIPAERGGRRQPPAPAGGYSTLSRFESDPRTSGIDWSLVIVDAVPLGSDACVRATVRFLVPEAPHEWLRDGERFELLEGRKVVAKGVVIPQTVPVPTAVTEFDLALLG
jgi:hypothetical protein